MKPRQGVEEPLTHQGHLTIREAKQPPLRHQPGMGATGTTRPTLLMSPAASQPPPAAQACATLGTGIPKSPREAGLSPLLHCSSKTMMPESHSPLGAPRPSLSPCSIKDSSPLLLNNRSTRCQEGNSSSALAEAVRRGAGAGRPAGRHSRGCLLSPLGRTGRQNRQGASKDGSKRG